MREARFADFPLAEYQRRYGRLRTAMEQHGQDAEHDRELLGIDFQDARWHQHGLRTHVVVNGLDRFCGSVTSIKSERKHVCVLERET